MRTNVASLIVWAALAACGGDDGGGGGGTPDARTGSDGSVDGAPQIDAPAGPVGSDDPMTPTTIALGETGSGMVPADVGGQGTNNDFWVFTPAATGDYVITLTGDAATATTWCGTTAPGQLGCACVAQGQNFPCCGPLTSGGMSCTARLNGLAAGVAQYVIAYSAGPAASYTLRIEAAP